MRRREYLGVAGLGLIASTGFTMYKLNTNYPNKPVSGEADPISVEKTFKGESIEYIKDKNVVRFVSGYEYNDSNTRNSDNDPDRNSTYQELPFEKWGEFASASVGSAAIEDAINDRYSELTGISIGNSPEKNKTAVSVRYTDKAELGFSQLVAATPKHVLVTLKLENQRYKTTVPVLVEHVKVVRT